MYSMISLLKLFKITTVILAHYKYEINITPLLTPSLFFCGCFLFKVELYEDFSKSQAKKEVDNILRVEEDQPQSNATSQQTHVFQVWQEWWHNLLVEEYIFPGFTVS